MANLDIAKDDDQIFQIGISYVGNQWCKKRPKFSTYLCHSKQFGSGLLWLACVCVTATNNFFDGDFNAQEYFSG